MRRVTILLVLIAMVGNASANLLTNADFELPGGGTATDWNTWAWGDGWAGVEAAVWGNGTWYAGVGTGSVNGGGGIYQTVAATGGTTYTLTVDSGADAWVLPLGVMLMHFYDSSAVKLGDARRNTVDPAVYGPNPFSHPWQNYTLVATAPAGTASIQVEFWVEGVIGSVGFDNASLTVGNPVPVLPDPCDSEIGVLIGKTLSWVVRQIPSIDPNVAITDPTLASHKLYINNDPNLVGATAIPITQSWSGSPARETYSPPGGLLKDKTYYWRVDSVLTDTTEITGTIWAFNTELSIPVITVQPVYQLIDLGTTATFSVTVTSPSPETYQWYKDGVVLGDGPTGSGATVSGATTATLQVTTAQVADEGAYQCEIDNGATAPGGPVFPTASDVVLLGIKREIAHWDFELGNTDSTIGGAATTTTVYGNPVTAVGIAGGGMTFDDNFGAEDMLYTAPNSPYFDICNYNMTVGCWIKTSGNGIPAWSPLVARDGEDGGWQLRVGGVGGFGDQRPIFTTRGVSGNVDGSDALKTAFDGNWHYVVGTYDGSYKKLYIDGVLQIVYWLDNGAVMSSEQGDYVSGFIADSNSGVSIAGRYRQNPPQVGNQFIAGTYDEVEIWNYVRSAQEIAQTYANLTGQNVCTSVPAYDFDGDCVQDLSDFSIFASGWLTDNTVYAP